MIFTCVLIIELIQALFLLLKKKKKKNPTAERTKDAK